MGPNDFYILNNTFENDGILEGISFFMTIEIQAGCQHLLDHEVIVEDNRFYSVANQVFRLSIVNYQSDDVGNGACTYSFSRNYF